MKNIDFQPSATTEKVFVASVTVGRHSVLLRLDAREKGVVRLDAAKPLMPMWEAIDNGVCTIESHKAMVASQRKVETLTIAVDG